MTKVYTLNASTIKDIIDNVPPEKWGDCLEELKVLVSQVGAVYGVAKITSDMLGISVSQAVQFPDTVEWKDDGDKTNTVRFRDSESKEDLGEIVFKD
ncbi:conserved hypothetical protein [Vibrio phage 249E41-1]|nr:conserved hypothetical protein [Vibrio phage 249E41-1]CAH9012031.1 conserved hypothetical protein [Vibrio phage 495E54-1]CAH9012111.1 conserved hypothetical protein [Vibrio phage 496E54-1]